MRLWNIASARIISLLLVFGGTFVGLVVISFLLWCSQSRADDMKRLTVEQVISIYNGLSQLDKYTDVCRDGSIEKQCERTYKFGGGMRMTLAVNRAETERIVKTYQQARNVLVAQYASGSVKVPDDKLGAFQDDDRAMYEQLVDITLAKFRRDDLKLEENPIPISVLSLIMPLIEK